MDPGVDLCLTQLLKGGVVEATWVRIQPHLGLSPPEQMHPAAEKCPQEVHSY
jgi:hypothetical protein